jgi:hypothetical protein
MMARNNRNIQIFIKNYIIYIYIYINVCCAGGHSVPIQLDIPARFPSSLRPRAAEQLLCHGYLTADVGAVGLLN